MILLSAAMASVANSGSYFVAGLRVSYKQVAVMLTPLMTLWYVRKIQCFLTVRGFVYGSTH